MAEQKESSVLFSLKELMNLEEDRIRAEESARKAKQDAEIQARADAERRVRDEEDARIRAEDERRRVEEQRAREEQARVDAIRQGEVEKARLDAENAARIEQMRHQQEHERSLTALKQDKHKRNLLIAAVGFALLFIVVAAVGGLAYKSSQDKAAAESAIHAQQLAESQAKLDALSRQLDDQNKNVDSLNSQLTSVTDVVQKEAIEKQLEEAKRAQAAAAKAVRAARSTGPSTGGGSAPPKPHAACTCQSGDPLCSCIQ